MENKVAPTTAKSEKIAVQSLLGNVLKPTKQEALPEKKTPHFSVKARNNVRSNIKIDGKEVHNGPLIAGKFYRYDFEEELALWTENVSQLNIYFNGKRISPQGAVANERNLIFSIDRKGL